MPNTGVQCIMLYFADQKTEVSIFNIKNRLCYHTASIHLTTNVGKQLLRPVAWSAPSITFICASCCCCCCCCSLRRASCCCCLWRSNSFCRWSSSSFRFRSSSSCRSLAASSSIRSRFSSNRRWASFSSRAHFAASSSFPEGKVNNKIELCFKTNLSHFSRLRSEACLLDNIMLHLFANFYIKGTSLWTSVVILISKRSPQPQARSLEPAPTLRQSQLLRVLGAELPGPARKLTIRKASANAGPKATSQNHLIPSEGVSPLVAHRPLGDLPFTHPLPLTFRSTLDHFLSASLPQNHSIVPAGVLLASLRRGCLQPLQCSILSR